MISQTKRWLADNPIRRYIEDQSGGLLRGPNAHAVRHLAERLSVSRQTLHAWMSGEVMPRMDHFLEFTKMVGVTHDQFFEWWKKRPKRGRKRRCLKTLTPELSPTSPMERASS